RAGFVANF
nr:Chain C, 8-mer model peptide [synthetic construct]7WT5_F Chain F, 8-mer model peptide [synthetic construct]